VGRLTPEITNNTSGVPEPSSFEIFGAALCGFLVTRRRQTRRER
jgi:hypothetical protein